MSTWCATIYSSPDTRVVDEPCGAADGSENTFIANPQGKARFYLPLPTLPDNTDDVVRERFSKLFYELRKP